MSAPGESPAAGRRTGINSDTASIIGELELVKVSLNMLDVAASPQTRAAMNAEAVDDYAEAYRSGTPMPPIAVFCDTSNGPPRYLLADGFHRVEAARKAGLVEVEAEVRGGGFISALSFALRSNAAHGLRRTNADKRHAVELALQHFSDLSDGQIAGYTGLSQPFVSSVRRQLKTLLSCNPLNANKSALCQGETEAVLPPMPLDAPPETHIGFPPIPLDAPPERRFGRDGKKRAVPTRHIPPPPPMPPPPPEPPKAVEERPRDGVGRLIPDALLATWEGREIGLEYCQALSRVKCALAKADETKDPVFALVSFQRVKAALEQAYYGVKSALPYAVCPTCQGHGHGCRMCHDSGFVGEFRWSTIVPQQTKDIIAAQVAAGKA